MSVRTNGVAEALCGNTIHAVAAGGEAVVRVETAQAGTGPGAGPGGPASHQMNGRAGMGELRGGRAAGPVAGRPITWTRGGGRAMAG